MSPRDLTLASPGLLRSAERSGLGFSPSETFLRRGDLLRLRGQEWGRVDEEGSAGGREGGGR